MKTKPFIGLLALALLVACAAPSTPTPTQQVDLANPASAYCVEQGYKSEIRTAADGSQSGVCIFPDGSECDEWAYFRGECGPASQTPLPANPPSKTWAKLFEGPNYGAFFDIILTPYGNALAVGATNHLHMPPYSGDALIMKLTLDGDVLWEKTWGGDGYEQAWGVANAGDGGFYVFGETDSYGAGDRDFFLLKVDKDGAEEWLRTYGHAKREWPFGMLQLSNGDLLIYGFTTSVSASERDQYALRVNPSGDVVWEYTVESAGEELILNAIELQDGSLVLAVNIVEDGKLVKLDADGNLQWEQRYELPGWQYESQVIETDDGGFLLAGFAMSPSQQADTWLARCDSTGKLEWETSFGNPTIDDYAISLMRLRDGTYLVGGLGSGMPLTRLDKDGSVLWTRSLTGSRVHGANTLIELEDGGFLIAGFIQISNGRSYDAILLRTDAEGRINE
jgi:putative hemolysin/outer membrane protein assembly factor BamB